MKDSLLLLATGVVISVAAWVFWHYFENDAAAMLSTIVLVGIAMDNARLRRELRALRGK